MKQFIQAAISSAASTISALLGLGDMTLDAWGTPKFTQPFSLFHGMWTFDIPASMWFMYENGTQVYTSTNIISDEGIAKLTADATNSIVLMESRECPRYQPNRGHVFSTALYLPDSSADATRDFGLFTPENGVFFRLKSDGLLYAVRRKGGVEVQEEVIDTSGLTNFDVEKNNIYDIQFQWRSAGNYKFFIGNPEDGTITLVHTFSLLGTLDGPSLEDPALPAAFKVTRGTEDASMNIGCADVTSEGGNLERHQYSSADAENVSVSGTDDPVLVIHSPLQINGVTNTRTVQLARITVTCSKKATFKIWTTRDSTAFTGGTFASLNEGTFIETDSPDAAPGAVRVTAVDTSKMNRQLAVPVEALVRAPIDNPLRERIHFPIVRGDYLVITVDASSASADAVAEWGEQI